MTLDELAQTLPNGFHDAELSSLTLDYARREARFALRVWVGDVDSVGYADREEYRPAELILSGLRYCVIEPPGPGSSSVNASALTIDTGALSTLGRPPEVDLPAATPPGTFANWFFVREWNAFFYVSAAAASLRWV